MKLVDHSSNPYNPFVQISIIRYCCLNFAINLPKFSIAFNVNYKTKITDRSYLCDGMGMGIIYYLNNAAEKINYFHAIHKEKSKNTKSMFVSCVCVCVYPLSTILNTNTI